MRQSRHTQDSQGQILGSTCWFKSLKPVKVFPFRSDAPNFARTEIRLGGYARTRAGIRRNARGRLVLAWVLVGRAH